MSLDNLVASQLEEPGTTPVENENEMVQEEEQASETFVNSDGNDDQTIDPQQQEQNEIKEKTQKRINELIGSRAELKEKVVQLEADKAAYEKYSQSQQDKTLKDYDLDTLTRFVADNQNDDELVAQVAEAREIIIEKRIDAKVNALADKQTALTNKEKGEQLTNLMIQNISGDRLRDTGSEYFTTANQYLYDLSQPEYSGLNKDQLIASLLAERDFQMEQPKLPKGPTMDDLIKNNKNNTIKANNRQAPSGPSDLASFLEGTKGRLDRSSITKAGTAKEAIMKLNLFKDLEGG